MKNGWAVLVDTFIIAKSEVSKQRFYSVTERSINTQGNTKNLVDTDLTMHTPKLHNQRETASATPKKKPNKGELSIQMSYC